jgi:hypothetical protein
MQGIGALILFAVAAHLLPAAARAQEADAPKPARLAGVVIAGDTGAALGGSPV